MPRVPLVEAPQTAGPSQPTGVRVNPGMFDAENQANARLGGVVEGIGSELGDLAGRVKHATDTAYVVGAQSTLEKTQQDFETWTKNHPDTSTWQDEYNARMGATKEDVQKGSENLSQMARLHLNTSLSSFEKRSGAALNTMTMAQNLHNAAGQIDETVDAASRNLDRVGAMAAIDSAVNAGIFSAATGAARKQRVGDSIAYNVATNEISSDANGFAKTINEKDADGNYTNHPELNPKAREILFKSAVKTAQDNRSLQLQQWRQMAADVNDGKMEPPDPEDIRTVADHLGIPPRVAEKIFIPPTQYNEEARNDVANAIASTPSHDLGNRYSPAYSHLEAQIYDAHLPAHAQEQLFDMLKDKSDPDGKANKPVVARGLSLIQTNLKAGVFGELTSRVPNGTNATGLPIFKTVPAKTRAAAQKQAADLTTDLMKFVSDPANTVNDSTITEFINHRQKQAKQKTGAAIFKFNP